MLEAEGKIKDTEIMIDSLSLPFFLFTKLSTKDCKPLRNQIDELENNPD